MTPSDTIEIHINGRQRPVPEGTTIAAVLVLFELKATTVVVEHNGEILPKDRFEDVSLCAGDHLEIVRFVGGGSR